MRQRSFPAATPDGDDGYRTVPEARIIAMIALAGWAHQLDDPAVAPRAAAVLQGWVELGLPCRKTDAGERLFDPVEVWVTMKRLGCAGEDGYFHQRYVATGRRLASDRASTEPTGPFRLDIRRTFHLAARAAGQRLRLRLPLPLERVHGQRSIDLLDEGIDREAITIHPDRLELRCAPWARTLALAARLGFAAPRDTSIGDDRNLYLRPREGHVVVSERIHDLARSLAGPGSTPAGSVGAFWTFLIERFVCVPIHYDKVDPAAPCDGLLDTGAYDCRLGAALFVALCRARGIPARINGGYLLYRHAPTPHFWAEYWCADRGWTPVDFLGWDLSGGGADRVWRDHFFGRIDARLVTEQLPLSFTGAPGVVIPRQWHMLQTATAGGVEIALTALDGRPIYADLIRLLD